MLHQIIWNGYINNTGYSIATQEYLLALKAVNPGLDIKLNYLNQNTTFGVSPNRQQVFASMRNKPETQPHIAIYHSIPHRYRRLRGSKKNIGLCLFETMNPPSNWIKMMNEMDMIITASQFNKRIFETNGVVKPVHVIPHTFNPELFHKDIKPLGRYRPFTFVASGTWKIRKNWETLVKSFYDAFEKKDDVCLYVKTDKPKDFEIMIHRVKRTTEWRSKDTAPIYCESKHCVQYEEMPHILKKGDVYISVSLGEGYGYDGANAMALGIPVLTTRYGGCLEYAKKDNCTFIEPYQYKTYSELDGIPQYRGTLWPVIRTCEIRDKMRYVKDNYKNIALVKADKAYRMMHDSFCYRSIGEKLFQVVTS